jgi:hypothetical protein
VVTLFHATIDILFTSDVVSPMYMNIAGAIVTVWGVVVLWVAGWRTLSRSRECVIAPVPPAMILGTRPYNEKARLTHGEPGSLR